MSRFIKLWIFFVIATPSFAKYSLAPFAGYTPTYQVFLGGGYFYEAEKLSVQLQGVLTFVNAFQVFSRFTYAYDPTTKQVLDLTIKKGFEPYYGEGSETVATARRDIETDILEFKAAIEKTVAKPLVFGIGIEGRLRRENAVKNSPGTRLFPNEGTMALYFTQRFDKRDREKSPRNGFLQELTARYTPESFTLSSGNAGFGQLLFAFSWYTELAKNWVLATNLEASASIGEPTYMYRYAFGGADKLRGFHENRFRGKHYYLQQTELRFPIAWIFQGGAFVGIGDIGDTNLNRPRVSYGAGLRITIPPDNLEVARIDFGMADDQVGLFIDFGYAF